MRKLFLGLALMLGAAASAGFSDDRLARGLERLGVTDRNAGVLVIASEERVSITRFNLTEAESARLQGETLDWALPGFRRRPARVEASTIEWSGEPVGPPKTDLALSLSTARFQQELRILPEQLLVVAVGEGLRWDGPPAPQFSEAGLQMWSFLAGEAPHEVTLTHRIDPGVRVGWWLLAGVPLLLTPFTKSRIRRLRERPHIAGAVLVSFAIFGPPLCIHLLTGVARLVPLGLPSLEFLMIWNAALVATGVQVLLLLPEMINGGHPDLVLPGQDGSGVEPS